MEISSTLVERGLDGVNELALPVAGVSCLYLMLRTGADAAPRRPLHVPRRTRLVRRGVSLLGLLLTAGSPASASARRSSVVTATEVRTEPGRFPPPRLPGSAGPAADEIPEVHSPPWRAQPPVREHRGAAGRPHPVVHGGTPGDVSGRLFGRWGAESPIEGDGLRRTAAVSSPAKLDSARRWHAVLPGETLWSIAAARLQTEDVRRIARYWPRIHRANRDEIGPNPNLIRPGQVLELPPERT